VDVDDARLVALGESLLPSLAPYLAAALSELDLAEFPLPRLAFGELPEEARALEVLSTTLSCVDTNGGAADWICLLFDLRERD
jgi:hypothetical protein